VLCDTLGHLFGNVGTHQRFGMRAHVPPHARGLGIGIVTGMAIELGHARRGLGRDQGEEVRVVSERGRRSDDAPSTYLMAVKLYSPNAPPVLSETTKVPAIETGTAPGPSLLTLPSQL
jgi:hypothetical protein